MSDLRVDPTAQNSKAIIAATESGNLPVVKLLMSDVRTDLSAQNNLALKRATSHLLWNSQVDSDTKVEIVRMLMSDSRVDPSALDNTFIQNTVRYCNIDVAAMLLTDPRVGVTKELIQQANHLSYPTTLDLRASLLKFLLYARPQFWPENLVGNDTNCADSSTLAHVLKHMAAESGKLLMLSVIRMFDVRLAARVGGVLRDVCSEWLCFTS